MSERANYRYRVLGTTDDVTTCDVCSKEDLKSTVVLAELDADGNENGILYAGSDCAAKRSGWTQKQVTAAAKAADRTAAEALEVLAGEADRIVRRARDIALAAWVHETYGAEPSHRGPWPQFGNVPSRVASPYQITTAWQAAGKPGLDPGLDVPGVHPRNAREHAGHLPAGVTLGTATPRQLIDAVRAAEATRILT